MKTYAIIPARAGSKGVKGKNTRLLNGEPLVSYSIKAALATSTFSRVIVSTDSSEISELAKSLGAEAPFIRPSEFAQDQSPDHAYIEHALDWFLKHESQEPDLMAILRPTTPLRDCKVLESAINKIKNSFDVATSLRSVHPLAEPPQKMLQIQEGWLTGFFPDDPRKDYFNLPRQSFPTAYQPNGYIDIVKTAYIRSEREMIFGDKMLGFVTPHSIEIDTEEDFSYLEYVIGKTDVRI
jgi:CMP-N,N'-diacetyllegionaminic acid synthase